jgi:hypothetical protein
MRNRIINGAMVIDQRNAGASYSQINGAYSLDRWAGNSFDGTVTTGKFTVQQNAGSVTTPSGFNNYLGVTSSAATSISSSAIYTVFQWIEGYNAADLDWGTANAKTVTLSFWVRSSLTGTFGGALQNSATDRSYPFSYTISSANTWEQKTITVAGDTSGTWLKTNGASIAVRFGLGVGSTYSGTAGSWAGANYYSATGATSVVGTNGATFYITGVQLEVGTQATSFEYRQYGTELALCERYFAKFSGTTSVSLYTNFAVGFGTSSTLVAGQLWLPVDMRALPTLTYSGSLRCADESTNPAISNLILNTQNTSTKSVQLLATSTGITQFRPYFIGGSNSATANVSFSAEL